MLDLSSERAPGFAITDALKGLPLVLEAMTEFPKPRSFELAGVYPTGTRGMTERVGISTKKPAFFLGLSGRSMMRGPGGRREKIGRFSPMG